MLSFVPPTVRCVYVPDAFHPARDRVITQVPWRFGGRVTDYLRDEWRDAPASLVVLRNGRRVPPEDWDAQPVMPDDEIGVVLWPGEPATIFFGIQIVVMVISAIVAVWSAIDNYRRAKIQGHHMARRQAAMALAMSDSAIYSWDGIQNTTQPGRPILVAYGRHRVGGQVIYAEPYKDKLGKNALDLTLCLSQGEIEEVETATIEIDGRPLSEFGNVSAEARVGTNDQTASANHSPGLVIKTLSNPGTEIIASGSAVTFTTQPNRTNYEVDLNFPQGLAGGFTKDSSGFFIGGLVFPEATFSIRHRVSPAGAWSTPATIRSGHRWNPAQFMLTYRSPPLAKNTYDIEITRLANTFNNVAVPTGYSIAIKSTNHQSYLSSVREYDNTGLRYPNLALLHVSALASDQLNGMMPTVTVIVKGRKVNVYTAAPGDTLVGPLVNGEITDSNSFQVADGHAGFQTLGLAAGDLLVITEGGTAGAGVVGTFTVLTVDDENNLTIDGTFSATGTGISFRIESALGVFTATFSRNPAWCILDLLTHDLYGAGAHLEVGPWDGTEDEGDLDIQAFIDAAAFCETLVPREPTADNPIAEGTATATTNAAGNTVSFTSGTTLPVGVQVEDRLTIEGGADANDYRIESIASDRRTCTVATVAGAAVTFTGSTLNDWHVDAMERRALCDYVIDGQSNVLDAVGAMAKVARMELVQGFAQYALIPDQAGIPVAVFGSGNIIDGTYKHEYLAHRMLANKVEVQFLNADLNYQQDLVQLEDPAVLTDNEEVVIDTVEAYGATRLTHVQRIAGYNHLSNRHEREMIEFETSIEGLPVRVFDVIAYVHETMRTDEFFSGRAAAGTEGVTLVLGQAIDVPSGTIDVYVQTHSDDGGVNEDTVLRGTIEQAAGTRVSSVTVTDWLDLAIGDVTYPDGPRPGDPWMLVPRATPEEAQRWWKVLNVSLSQGGQRKIRAVAYREEIYDEEPVPATLVAVT